MSKFPDIPGVSFKLLPDECFRGMYAIASNRTVWIRRRGGWRRMETLNGHFLGEVVFLNTGTLGRWVRTLDELMESFNQ